MLLIKPTNAIANNANNNGFSHYLTLNNLFNILLLSVAILEFYPTNNLLVEAGGKKSKKYVVVKEVGKTYKKVPIYKKVPVKIYKVVIKKKKSEKPWKKWFKKSMIVKIPQEHKHHHHGHHHHHAASEDHKTWALPAFIATPSSMSDIIDAWSSPSSPSGALTSSTADQYSKHQQVGATNNVEAAASQQVTNGMSLPTSVSDLKSVGSEIYPAFLATAQHLAASALNNQVAQANLESYQRHQQQQQQQAAEAAHQAAANTMAALQSFAEAQLPLATISLTSTQSGTGAAAAAAANNNNGNVNNHQEPALAFNQPLKR